MVCRVALVMCGACLKLLLDGHEQAVCQPVSLRLLQLQQGLTPSMTSIL